MISRQLEYQKKQRELGNCVVCGKQAEPKRNKNNKYNTMAYCEFHRFKHAEYYHKRKENKIINKIVL
jgi:hypothetical protein